MEHCGSTMPTPTKLRNASVKMTVGMENITCVIIGPMVLGRISLKIMCPLPAPSVRLARTYSCSFIFSISARAILLMPIHSVSSSVTITRPMPLGIKIASTDTITSRGILLAISTKRCMMLSTRPPK